MASEAMTRDELIEFVRYNFVPDDIWPGIHDECLDEYPEVDDQIVMDRARDLGWHHDSDFEGDPGLLGDLVEESGYVLGLDQRDAAAYHDDNGHEGAVRWCTHPACNHQN